MRPWHCVLETLLFLLSFPEGFLDTTLTLVQKEILHENNHSTVFDRCLFTRELNGIGTVPWDWGQLEWKKWHLYHQSIFHEGSLIQTAYWDQGLAHTNSWTIIRNRLETILASTGQKWPSGCSINPTLDKQVSVPWGNPQNYLT